MFSENLFILKRPVPILMQGGTDTYDLVRFGVQFEIGL